MRIYIFHEYLPNASKSYDILWSLPMVTGHNFELTVMQ